MQYNSVLFCYSLRVLWITFTYNIVRITRTRNDTVRVRFLLTVGADCLNLRPLCSDQLVFPYCAKIKVTYFVYIFILYTAEDYIISAWLTQYLNSMSQKSVTLAISENIPKPIAQILLILGLNCDTFLGHILYKFFLPSLTYTIVQRDGTYFIF